MNKIDFLSDEKINCSDCKNIFFLLQSEDKRNL